MAVEAKAPAMARIDAKSIVLCVIEVVIEVEVVEDWKLELLEK